MSLVPNERTKYLATLINTVAAASIVAGVVAPMVAFTFGMPGPISGGFTVAVGIVWLLVGAALHYTVRIILGTLKP
ncbi:hypothetical protein [Ancylobacter oerskovii]|uniref:Amino acid transporter n=1 Tax=Ancylobacter oerskovii TaxID=459519 RepID=A0ABW4YT98_9HYPH|nr:hypothetical protein [Ancylobacter oerskovii]MBS7543385.1 hypothetical protein [Ancylobacter oerskovii]